MKILLDENFPKSAADVIAAAGHEVIPFADVCEFGADDEEVFGRAQNLGADGHLDSREGVRIFRRFRS